LTNGVRDEYCSEMGTRNPFEARTVVSRRGGPTKPPLSRDAIVTEALHQLAREGLEGMSLRKIAEALETGPASLYAYVDDLHELHALVLDRALGGVDIRGARKAGWHDRLLGLFQSYFRVLSGTPGLAQLALGTIAVGPNALRILETLLGLLEEAGTERATAALAIDLLVLYVTALAAEQSKGLAPDDPEGPVARAIRGVSPAEYPRIHAAREDLLAGGGTRFAWAIDVMLRGILPATSLGAPAPPLAEETKSERGRRRPAPAR
jgi:AcrR family transcriptional regulator